MSEKSAWRPIRTAPTDQNPVALFFPNGYWATGLNVAVGFRGSDGDWYAGEADSKSMTAFGGVPTYWMPLDPLPEDRRAS